MKHEIVVPNNFHNIGLVARGVNKKLSLDEHPAIKPESKLLADKPSGICIGKNESKLIIETSGRKDGYVLEINGTGDFEPFAEKIAEFARNYLSLHCAEPAYKKI